MAAYLLIGSVVTAVGIIGMKAIAGIFSSKTTKVTRNTRRKVVTCETEKLRPRVSTLVDDGTEQLMDRASRFADTTNEGTVQIMTRASGFPSTGYEGTEQLLRRVSEFDTVNEGTGQLVTRTSKIAMTVDRGTGNVLNCVLHKVELTEPVSQAGTLSLSNLIDCGKFILDMIPPVNRLMPVKLSFLFMLSIIAIHRGYTMIDDSLSDKFYFVALVILKLFKWLNCKIDESTCPEEYHDNKVVEMNEELNSLKSALVSYRVFAIVVVFWCVLLVAVLLKIMLVYAQIRMKNALENKPESLFVCNICCTAPMDFVFLPCYHMYSCMSCLDGMQRDKKRPVCPICNIRSQKIKRVNVYSERINFRADLTPNRAN